MFEAQDAKGASPLSSAHAVRNDGDPNKIRIIIDELFGLIGYDVNGIKQTLDIAGRLCRRDYSRQAGISLCQKIINEPRLASSHEPAAKIILSNVGKLEYLTPAIEAARDVAKLMPRGELKWDAVSSLIKDAGGLSEGLHVSVLIAMRHDTRSETSNWKHRR